MKPSDLKAALRVVLYYFFFGILWIAVSDRVLELIIADPHKITEIQTLKGWVFVFASTILLYIVTLRELRRRAKTEKALAESEEKYRTLMENANDAIVVFDAATELIIDANKRAGELFGLPAEQLAGQHFTRLHPPEDAEQCRALLWDILRGRTVITSDLCAFSADGRSIPVEISSNAVTVGGLSVIQVIFRDITERKRAEEALRKTTQTLQALVNASPVAILVLDPDGTVLLWNPAAERVFGWTGEEAVGRPYPIVPPDKQDEFLSLKKRILAGETLAGIELRRQRKDGSPVDLELSAAALHDERGRLIGVVTVSADITERKRAEEALRESAERIAAISESSMDAIILVDENGVITYFNPAAERMLGYTQGEAVGKQLHSLIVSEKAREKYIRALPPYQKTGKCEVLGRPLEMNPVRKDGTKFPAEASIVSLQIQGKWHAVGTIRDITERKRAEEALRRERNRAQRYLDIAGVIMVVVGADEKVQLINRKGAQILGYEEREITGKNWFDTFVPERVRSEVRAAFFRVLAGEAEQADYVEHPVAAADGEERMIAWHHSAVVDEEVRIVAMLSSGEDITARRKAEEKARSRLQHLDVLHAIDLLITSSLDLRVTLRQFIDLVVSQFRVDAADVLLLNPHMQTLEYAAGRGFLTSGIEQTRLRLGQGIAGRAALERRSIHIPNTLDPSSGFIRALLLVQEGFIAYYAVPIIAKGQVKGVLEIHQRSPRTLDQEELDYLEALAAQAAIAIDNAALFNDLQRSNIELTLAYDATLEGWARALDLRSRATERHTERVTEMTVRLAKAMGVGDAELVHIRRGALLHDIGKIGIPDSILNKPGKLTDEEWALMRKHPVFAFEMLKSIAYLRPAIDIPYAHHEWWDGSGYPRGLKGEQIPLAARIFSVSDIWDAMTDPERPYRTAQSKDEVREHIRSLAGIQLDPKVVEAFLKMEW